MEFKREITFTDNKSQLINGYGYIVLYYDNESQCERMTLAKWTGSEFDYYDGRFFQGTEPQFNKSERGRILGVLRAVDWNN